MASVTIEKVDLSSLSYTCRITAELDHTVGCGWKIRPTKLNWTSGKWETRLFFLLRRYTLSSLRNGPHQKHYRSFGFTWFLWPLWCDRAALFFYFERRYQKSSTSLKLGLVVWNHRFQRGHNPSSFKLPLCGNSKTWTNIGSLSVCCFDKVTG